MSAVLDDLHTIRDWLRWAISRFNEAGLSFGHGCDNAHDEAAWLILHTLHLPIDQLEPWLDTRLTRDERLAVVVDGADIGDFWPLCIELRREKNDGAYRKEAKTELRKHGLPFAEWLR